MHRACHPIAAGIAAAMLLFGSLSAPVAAAPVFELFDAEPAQVDLQCIGLAIERLDPAPNVLDSRAIERLDACLPNLVAEIEPCLDHDDLAAPPAVLALQPAIAALWCSMPPRSPPE